MRCIGTEGVELLRLRLVDAVVEVEVDEDDPLEEEGTVCDRDGECPFKCGCDDEEG
jgi:hypothetical protein